MAADVEGGRTVAATLLFTDLVGSTELTTSLSARAADELRRAHLGLLRDALDGHGGTEVKNLGDGIMAVFPSVGSALDAATAIQRSAHLHGERHPDTPLRIRIGVASGDCVHDDGDYFGEPVVQAARLCDVAEGGTILTGETVRLSAPRGHHRFDRLGPVELKGLPEPVEVARLDWSPPEPSEGTAVPLPDRLAVAHSVPYVGRAAERDELESAVKSAVAGSRQVVLISGEAGQGKTRLATEVARAAHEDGALVLHGRCDDQLPVPYAPWAQALGHWSRHAPPDAGHADGAELERLLPELFGGRRGDELSSSDQHALYSAVTSLLAELSGTATVLLVLDDLHWADRDSLMLLRHVAAHLLVARLVVVGTYRDTDLHDGHPLEELLAALRRETGVARIHLDGLAADEIRSLVALTTTGTHPHHLAEVLADETDGNPFFLGELLGHLAGSGASLDALTATAGTPDRSGLAVPPSVREVVVARVGALGGTATRTLSAASVIGREFDTELLAALVDVPEHELVDVLDAAVAAGILDEIDERGERLAFSHALVARVLTETLSPRRRARLHRSIAEAMEHGPRAGSWSAAERAVHGVAGQVPGGEARSRTLAREAGDEALRRRAPEEAVAWYRRALELAVPGGEDECELLVLLGDAERLAGHPEHRAHLLDAARSALRLGRDDLLVAAALANHRGFQSAAGTPDGERIEVLRRALDVVDPSAETDRARLLVQLATELGGDDPDRAQLAIEAVDTARRSGDRDTFVDVVALAMTVLVAPEHFDRAAALSAEAMELTADGHDPARRMQVLFGEQGVQLILGEGDEAARCAREYEELVHRLGQPVRLWTAALRSAILATVQGDHERAQERIDATLELGTATGQPDAFVAYGALVMGLAIHQGRTEELIPLVQDAAAQNPGLPILRAGAAAFLADAGRLDDALAAIASLGDLRSALPRDHFWLATSVLLAEAATAVGDLPTASTLHEMLEPYGDRVAAHPAGCLGAVSLALGGLAATLGLDTARGHLERSLSIHQRLRSPYYVARSHLALADGEPVHLEAASELARRHGFAGIERAVAARRGEPPAPGPS